MCDGLVEIEQVLACPSQSGLQRKVELEWRYDRPEEVQMPSKLAVHTEGKGIAYLGIDKRVFGTHNED